MPAFTATFIGAFADPHKLLLKDTDRVLICVGRSNVGKSSFINVLAKSKICRVSTTPGRTQTINLFRVGKNSVLIDLPGYGFARHSKTGRDTLETLIHETLLALGDREPMICLITDSSVGLTALDEEMLAFLRTEHAKFLVIANKADKLNQSERSKQEKSYKALLSPEERVYFTSTKNLDGFNRVHEQLALDN